NDIKSRAWGCSASQRRAASECVRQKEINNVPYDSPWNHLCGWIRCLACPVVPECPSAAGKRRSGVRASNGPLGSRSGGWGDETARDAAKHCPHCDHRRTRTVRSAWPTRWALPAGGQERGVEELQPNGNCAAGERPRNAQRGALGRCGLRKGGGEG